MRASARAVWAASHAPRRLPSALPSLRRLAVLLTIAALASACEGFGGPEETESVAAETVAPVAGSAGAALPAGLAAIDLVLWGEGRQLVRMHVPAADYQRMLGQLAASGGQDLGPDPQIEFRLQGSEAVAGVSCFAGSECRLGYDVPANAPITLEFLPGDLPWQYPVSASGGGCDAKQSVFDAVIKSSSIPPRAFGLSCTLRVASKVTVEARWRSGTVGMCWDQPGNAPVPPDPRFAAAMHVWGVVPYPERPPAPPAHPATAACSAWPSSDAAAMAAG